MTRPRPLVVLLLIAVLSGCSLLKPPEPPAVNAPKLPAEVFAALPDRPSGISTIPDALATDGSTVVAVGSARGRVDVPFFRSSRDGGATWAEGRLTDAAAQATRIGESSSGLAAQAGGVWVALGRYENTSIAWTSADGQVWERKETTGIDRPRSSLHSLVAVPGGFLLVGATTASDDIHDAPAVWRSPDGVAWQATTLPGLGRLRGVAVRDSTVVAVGSVSLDEERADGRRGFPLVFTSTDAGATWQVRPVPEPAGSNAFNTSLRTVTATPTGFVAAGSFHTATGSTYRSYGVTSPDGQGWSPLQPALPQALDTTGVAELLTIGGALVVVSQSEEVSTQRDEVAVHRLEAGGFVPVALPEVPGVPAVWAGAAAGSLGVLALGSALEAGEGGVWATKDGSSWARSQIPPPAGARPAVNPRMLTADGGLRVYGEAQGVPAVWRPEGSKTVKPSLVLDARNHVAGGAAASPTQQVVWGSNGRKPWVRISSDGTSWKEVDTGAFGPVATQYQYASVHAMQWVGDRWVAVGERSTNGSLRQSALVVTSTDGVTWAPGTSAREFRRGDSSGEDDPLTDLDGLEDQTRVMAAVTGVGQGLVAVGRSATVRGDEPRAWLSADRSRWTIVELPMGDLAEARASQVVATGERVVATGHSRERGKADWFPTVWTSTDGGQSWRVAVMSDWGYASHVSLLSHGDEVVCVVASRDRKHVFVWRSNDGLQWSGVELAVPGMTDGVEAVVQDAVVDGTKLAILTQVVNRLEGVTVIVEHRL